ncbi:MAG: MFS transporter, partial [Janthinobacterium lividum]
LYVTVALVYPQRLRPAVFGVFASAWVIPSLVGPLLAGFVAARFGWPWVFAGVLGLVLLAAAPVLPVLLRIPANATTSTASDGEPGGESYKEPGGVPARTRTRYGAAFVVAAAVVVLSSAGAAGAWRWVLALAALTVLAVGVRPLLPRGTLTARAGLPATVLLRGSIAATFYSTEVYLPLMLHERFGLPLWAAGAVLTAGAIAWASGSAVQGRLGDRLPHHVAVRVGAVLLLVGVTTQLGVAAITSALSPEISPSTATTPSAAIVMAAVGWFVGGGGMGLMYPRTTVLVLARSDPGSEGAGSAALTISDAAGGATALALTGLLFGAFGAACAGAGFATTLLGCSLLASVSLAVALRVGRD